MMTAIAWIVGAGFFWCLCAAAADDSPIVPGSLSRRDYPDADSWCRDPEPKAEAEPQRPVPVRDLPAPAAAQTRTLRLL